MKVAIFGAPHMGDRPDEFVAEPKDGRWTPNHSVSSSSVALKEGFERHGFEAYVAGVEDIGEADAAFVCEFNFFRVLKECGKWDFNKPTVAWLHHWIPGPNLKGQDYLDLCRGVCFTRPEAMEKFRAENGDFNYWLAPWGFPDWWSAPPVKPNPYPKDGKLHVVYAGRCPWNSRMPDYIEKLTKAHPDVVVHMITDVGVLQHDPRNKSIVTRFERNPQVDFVGSRIHGTFLNYLYYADLAIDTGIVPQLWANNCKIWDYLAMGVPVVTNHETGGMELIRETGCGVISPGVDAKSWLEGFSKARSMKFPRGDTIRWMRENHAWDVIIDGWIEEFKACL